MNKFFSHPMRAFFAGGLAFGLLGAISFFGDNYVLWHRLIFLNLLPACVYSGFLITALPDWTNYKGNLKPISYTFGILIFLNFLSSFFWLQVAAIFMSAFWLVWLIFAGFMMFLDRNSNNFSILLVLLLFFVSELAYAITLDDRFLNAQIHINIAAILLVSFRVSVVLGAEALKSSKLKDPVFIPNSVHKNLAVSFALLYFGASLFVPQKVAGFCALALGFALMAKLKELHYFDLLKKYYVLIYYLCEFSGAVGYLWLGAMQVSDGYAADALHLISICYMFGIIFLIAIVAGLRHSGFVELNFPRFGVFLFVLVGASGIIRALMLEFGVILPAILLGLAFIFYAVDFLPIFAKREFSDDPE